MGLLCSNPVFLFSYFLILSFFPVLFLLSFLPSFLFILSVFPCSSLHVSLYSLILLPVLTTVTEYTCHTWHEHLSVTVPGGNYLLFPKSLCEYHSDISQLCFSGGMHTVSMYFRNVFPFLRVVFTGAVNC